MVDTIKMELDSYDQEELSDHKNVAIRLAGILYSSQGGLSNDCVDEVDQMGVNRPVPNYENIKDILDKYNIDFIDISRVVDNNAYGFFGIETSLNSKEIDEEESSSILQSVSKGRSHWRPELIANFLVDDYRFQGPRKPFMKPSEAFKRVDIIGGHPKQDFAHEILDSQVEQLSEWLSLGDLPTGNLPGAQNFIDNVMNRYDWYYASNPSETDIHFALFSPYVIPANSTLAKYLIDYRERHPRDLNIREKVEKWFYKFKYT
jgi:hypothetical protein